MGDALDALALLEEARLEVLDLGLDLLDAAGGRRSVLVCVPVVGLGVGAALD